MEVNIQDMQYIGEELVKRNKTLMEAHKTLEAQVKSIAGEVARLEHEQAQRVAQAKEQADRQIAELKAQVEPYKQTAQQVERAKLTLAAVREDINTETQNLLAKRHAAIKELDARCAAQQKRLDMLLKMESEFRAKVNAL